MPWHVLETQESADVGILIKKQVLEELSGLDSIYGANGQIDCSAEFL